MDRPFLIAWEAGEILAHAGSEKEAREIAMEYLRAKEILKVRPSPNTLCQESIP